MQIKNGLKKIGLNQKQAEIYLAVLELGSATVSMISKKSGILRTSCYDVFEVLSRKGIISSLTKKKIKYFSVDDPRNLIDIEKQRLDSLENIIPQLRARYALAKDSPQTSLYQGAEGMKQVFEDLLKVKNKEILSFGSIEDLSKFMGEYHQDIIKRRIGNKIVSRVILKDSPSARQRQQVGMKQLRRVKIIPKSFDVRGILVIFDNKIALFSFIKDYIAVVIDNKQISDILRTMFEYIWAVAE